MHGLIASLGLRSALAREAPGCLIAFVIAEMFYKFYSFTLECLAFLATWWLASFLVAQVRNKIAARRVAD